MKLKLIFAIGLFLTSGAAYAACSGPICSDVLVERLYVNANGVVYVSTDGVETALNCTAVSGIYVTLYHTDTNFDAIYSTLLAAKLVEKTVGIRIEDSSSDCRILYVTVD